MTTRFKKMVDYSFPELTDAVEDAKLECSKAGLDFYKILKGVDAFMENRRRRHPEKSLNPAESSTGPLGSEEAAEEMGRSE